MKEFNETMIKNYRELNNCGTFEIDGYTVKFDNRSKTLKTEYPYAKELRVWWFNIENTETIEEAKKERQANFILEQGFNEVTENTIEVLSSKTTKSAKFTLERMKKFNHRIFKNNDLVLVFGSHIIPVQELNQLSRIYKCSVEDASKYFDRIGMWLIWNNL